MTSPLPPARCPHYDAVVIGPALPDPLTEAASWCPQCRVWVRPPLRLEEPRDAA